MYENIYRHNTTKHLCAELLELNHTVHAQELLIEEYRLKAAMYKSFFFGKSELAERLQSQIHENYDNCIVEFDGMCYASWRSKAIYIALEDMIRQGLITKTEYEFCNV